MKPLSRNGDSYSIHTTPSRYLNICKSTWNSNICSFAFLGYISGEFQRERCILGTVLAKFSFAFVFTSPLGHGRGFSWWREIVPHKTCPAGRLNFVSRESEENCKLRQTFLLFAQFAPSHLFNTPHSSSNDWTALRNDYFTPSDNILLVASAVLWRGLQNGVNLNSLQCTPDISPSPCSYHRHYAVGLSIWDSFQCFKAGQVPASWYTLQARPSQ